MFAKQISFYSESSHRAAAKSRRGRPQLNSKYTKHKNNFNSFGPSWTVKVVHTKTSFDTQQLYCFVAPRKVEKYYNKI